MTEEHIKFCCYLTGHDEATILQMYDDWKAYEAPAYYTKKANEYAGVLGCRFTDAPKPQADPQSNFKCLRGQISQGWCKDQCEVCEKSQERRTNRSHKTMKDLIPRQLFD